MLQSSRPKSHLEGARGRRDFRWWMLKKVVSALNYTASIIRLNLYSGQGAFHRGGKTEGEIFFFPIMHLQQGPNWHRGLGSFSRDKHPVSCLTPSEGSQRHPFTTTRVSVVFSNITKDPRGQRIGPPAADLSPWPTTPTCSVFFALLQIPMAAKLDVPMSLWHRRDHCGCPEKRLWKQLLADEKFMQCYHIFEYPRLLLNPVSLSLAFLPSLWMMHRWHNSPYSAVGLGLFSLWSVGEY